MFLLTGLRRAPILAVPQTGPDAGRDAMTTAPGGALAAPGQKLQSASPQPGTAGAAGAAGSPQPRLVVVTLPGEIDTSNDGQVQDTLTRALDDGTAVLVADAGRTTFCGCSGVTALLLTHHRAAAEGRPARRSEEHTSELQSLAYLVCRLLLEKKNKHC